MLSKLWWFEPGRDKRLYLWKVDGRMCGVGKDKGKVIGPIIDARIHHQNSRKYIVVHVLIDYICYHDYLLSFSFKAHNRLHSPRLLNLNILTPCKMKYTKTFDGIDSEEAFITVWKKNIKLLLSDDGTYSQKLNNTTAQTCKNKLNAHFGLSHNKNQE